MSDLLFQSALQAQHAGDAAEAVRLCREILTANRRNFNALYLLGLLHAQLDEPQEAERLIGEALEINPRSPDAHYNRGCVFQRLHRLEEAILCFEKAAAIKPDYADAWINRGASLSALKRYGEAASVLDRASRLAPDNAALWTEHGNALSGDGRHQDALASYDRALKIRPLHAEAWENRGRALMLLLLYSEALASFDAALKIAPGSAAAWTGRGAALGELRRPGEALAAFDRALALKPQSETALVGRGNIFFQLNRYEDALAAFDRVLAARGDSIQALINGAAVLFEMKRVDEAIRYYERALSLDSDIPYARGHLAFCRLHGCDWRAFDLDRKAIESGLRKDRPIIVPFAHISLSHSSGDQLRCAGNWSGSHYPPMPALWRGEPYRHDVIRVAYLSADFQAHATAHLMGGVFAHHDRTRFETIAVSWGPDDKSRMRARLIGAFDRFVDVRQKSDFEVASLLRARDVDIIVDLKGLTKDSRCGILAYRAAPIQAQYLGYPGTTGAPYVDYILADDIVIPEEQAQFYSEKIVYLPDSYQCNDGARESPPPSKSRTDYGLPETGFVFCCFNNNFKILPEIFAIWMRLLARVEKSVLWLMVDNPAASRNLVHTAQARGIAAERLVFAPRLGVAEHLARHRAADLFLDTLPYGAHTTASDALWMDLPVVTCLGTTFAGRVGASLLHAVGLPELVCSSLRDYENLALRLARDPIEHRAVKETLARNRLTHPLFDTIRFTRNFESALTIMRDRHRRAEPPSGFRISEVSLPGANNGSPR